MPDEEQQGQLPFQTPQRPQTPATPQESDAHPSGVEVQQPQTPATPETAQFDSDLKRLAEGTNSCGTAEEMTPQGDAIAQNAANNAAAKRQALSQLSQQTAQQALQRAFGRLVEDGFELALDNRLGGVGQKAIGTIKGLLK